MITRFSKTFLFASCLINTSFTICAMGIIPRVVHDSVFISLFGLSTTPFDSSPLQNKIKHPYLNFGPFINKYFGMSPLISLLCISSCSCIIFHGVLGF